MFTGIIQSIGKLKPKKNNPKIRSLSYAFQYLTLSGSIGYVGKQLFDSGFLSPLSLNPDSINSLSPLGYKDFFKINNHNANNLAVKASVDEINLANNLKNQLTKNKFSFKSIEFRNNTKSAIIVAAFSNTKIGNKFVFIYKTRYFLICNKFRYF